MREDSRDQSMRGRLPRGPRARLDAARAGLAARGNRGRARRRRGRGGVTAVLAQVLVAFVATTTCVAAGAPDGLLAAIEGGEGILQRSRRALEDRGVDVSLFYNAFAATALEGGANPGALRASGSGDLFVLVDLATAVHPAGGTLLALLKAAHGRNLNPAIAALSDPIDDGDGDDAYLDQLWVEQPFAHGRLHWRVGYLDQQVLIDRNAYANMEDRQFFATALDNANVIVPVGVGLGMAVTAEPWPWLRLVWSMSDASGRVARAGWDTAFDGFDAHFHVFEAAFVARPSSSRGALEGNYRFGLVLDPRQRAKFGAPPAPATAEVESDEGFYLSFDQKVFVESGDPRQGVGLFARYGTRDGSVNRVSHFWSFGAEATGAVPGRGADALGLGFYGAHAGDRFRREAVADADVEAGAEAWYRVQVTPWLEVSPDLQYLRNPSSRRSAADAVVAVLRVRITF